jgi:hypothetical protein
MPKTPRKTPKKPTKTRAQESSVFEHLTLKNVRLIELNTQLNVKDGKLPNKPVMESHVTVGPSQSSEPTILVDGFLKLEAHPEGGDEDSSTLIIQIHYQCVYGVVDGKAEDYSDKSNQLAAGGMFVMWPHFRELIHSLTGRMTIPPIVIPMFTAGPAGKGKGNRVTLFLQEDKD